MANFIPLEEAAKRLGVATDRLVEMRSRGEIRGFRDGASWKFPEAEIERLATEMDEQVLDEAAGDGSSLLISEESVGSDPGREGKSKVIGGDPKAAGGSGRGSDVGVGSEANAGGDAADGSDDFTMAPLDEVDADELVLRADDSGHLDLAVEPRGGSSGRINQDDLASAAAKGESGSKVDIDLSLEEEPLLGQDDQDDVLSGMDLMSAASGGTGDLIHGDSDPALLSGSGAGDLDDALSDDDELVIADDDDDLVLGGAGSDISVAGDSGINLMSPSDSGLSLESEPLDLAGSSISALDLGAEVRPGSGTGSGPGGGSGSGSLVDFQADEDFQLSPSGVGLEVDDDSGSQVIEVDDSSAFGSGVDLAGEGMGDDVFGGDDALMAEEAIVADESMGIDGMGIDAMTAPTGAAPAPAYEVPFSLFNVLTLVGILIVMSLGGMLMTDLVRNMWAYNEPVAPVSSLTDALISMAGLGS